MIYWDAQGCAVTARVLAMPHRDCNMWGTGGHITTSGGFKDIWGCEVLPLVSHKPFHTHSELLTNASPWATEQFLISDLISFIIIFFFYQHCHLTCSFLTLGFHIIIFSWRSCFLHIIKPKKSHSVSTWSSHCLNHPYRLSPHVLQFILF